MSARVGSIGDNNIGGWHSYRASKSALNQLNQCLSIEFARKKLDIACILLHPGTVDTDLSMPFQKVLVFTMMCAFVSSEACVSCAGALSVLMVHIVLQLSR